MLIYEWVGYLGALLVGVFLGLTGGGGSILALPVMVYLHHINPELARTYSLFIIGSGALVGYLQNIKYKTIDYKIALGFSIPSLITIYITSTFIYPKIPKVLFQNDSFVLDKPSFVMIIFSTVMLIASISMIKNGFKKHNKTVKTVIKHKVLKVTLVGILVGFLTEMIGAGGGFLIVPVLVLLFQIPIKNAVATSLFIVLINSVTGIFFHIDTEDINWLYLSKFTGISLIGILIGTRLIRYINERILKIGFGFFILIMGVFILTEKFIN